MLGSCGSWENGNGGAFGWTTSNTGCAVVGYSGYERPYSTQNLSDVQGCNRGKGYAPNGTGGGVQTWYNLGCQNANDVFLPWGNVFAYTQVQGRSLSGVTGFAYRWWD